MAKLTKSTVSQFRSDFNEEQNMNENTPQTRMEKGRIFAEANLKALVKEQLEWNVTGLLNSGAGGLTRELAHIVAMDDYSLSVAQYSVAQSLVTTAALQFIANLED
jgi:hypothetical protein